MLAKHGVLQLWSSAASDSSLSVAHSFGAYPTSSVQWHSEVAGDGAMLLARSANVAILLIGSKKELHLISKWI